MAFFVQAANLMTLFLGLEWFSIALYVLCALDANRSKSLEAGLKYLIIGSFGSAILLFGSALVYGATGELGFHEIGCLGEDTRPAAGRRPRPDPHRDGVQGLRGALPHVDAGRLRGRAYCGDGVHGCGHESSRPCGPLSHPDDGLPCRPPALDDRDRRAAPVSRSRSATLPPSRRATSSGCSAYSSVSHAGFMLIAVAANNALGGRALLYYLIPYARDVARRLRRRGGPRAGAAARRDRSRRSPAWAGSGRSTAPPCGCSCSASPGSRSRAACSASSTCSRPPTTAAGGGWSSSASSRPRVSLYYYLGVVRSMYMRPGRQSRRQVPGVAAAGGSPPRDPALALAVGRCPRRHGRVVRLHLADRPPGAPRAQTLFG